jgi:hypothetical protein
LFAALCGWLRVKGFGCFTLRVQKGSQSGANENNQSKWRQVYRLLCKRSPLEQEMAMEFACLPMVRTSFTGEHVYAPVPGSFAVNNDRHAYMAYQQRLVASMERDRMPEEELPREEKRPKANDAPTNVLDDEGQKVMEGNKPKHMSFLQWYRIYRIHEKKEDQDDQGPYDKEEPVGEWKFAYEVKRRNVAGPGRGKPCAVGVSFAFELLDVFLGQWAATFLPETQQNLWHADMPRSPKEVKIDDSTRTVPENTVHLDTVLQFFENNPEKMLEAIVPDLKLRGLGQNRIKTFNARVYGHSLLLKAVKAGELGPAAWSAKKIYHQAERQWSPEQQAVLDAIEAGTAVADANDMAGANRILQIAGGPGTGKTEVLIEAAIRAGKRGCRVLLGGPIGLLVTSHRQRVPANLDITVETIHSAFKIGRDRDKQYIPPGRLRQYDLIIFDEVSQIDAEVWSLLQSAFAELSPSPFVVFVGDFQQLQPVEGEHQLQADLDQQFALGGLERVVLQQHAAARTTDADMLQFLQHVRLRQPSRDCLEDFFDGRILSKDLKRAVATSIEIEQREGKHFTFLTVTNKGAAEINARRLEFDFPAIKQQLDAEGGLPGDPACGGEEVLFDVAMRERISIKIEASSTARWASSSTC